MAKQKKKRPKLKTIVDESTKLPEKQGNGILRIVVKMDEQGEVNRYSMAYINSQICNLDNGRVLGYDNSHGYHHRHYMGKEEPIEFQSYEAIVEQFEKEWRVLHEKAKKQKSNKAIFTVKTGTVEEFFDNARKVMRALDKKEPINPSRTLVFTHPMEMLHFLSEKKLKLIHAIREHPDSITNIAKMTKRNRAAVYRDIHEMEQFGLVKTHEEINPGHGRHKIVELVAPALKLEAYI